MYEGYLRDLLAPLGIYDLTENSVSGAAICALGTGLDDVSDRLAEIEREAPTATAEDEGLDRREALFARRPAAVTAEDRRAAIAALLQIDGDSLTPEAIEMGDGQLRVIFPEVAGEPEGFPQIQKIILDILPCHLGVEFYFRYLTWEECEAAGYTWAQVEAAGHTWESFQLAVPPEELDRRIRKGRCPTGSGLLPFWR